jgi:hypothetical protein
MNFIDCLDEFDIFLYNLIRSYEYLYFFLLVDRYDLVTDDFIYDFYYTIRY